MAKAGNFNVTIEQAVKDEFEAFSESVVGFKYEHLTGAVKAIHAIYEIDRLAAFDLMDADISISDARQIIIDAAKKAGAEGGVS